MTASVKSYAYTEVGDERLVVDDLPARRWVECASCVEGLDIEHVSEAEAWARKHHAKNLAHDRFRVVRQTGWRFTPRLADGLAPTP
ncbi:hypothetical protein ACIRU3_40330 [Streptomyces sp. NPDC101151]|uniref:DUF7848 domain-containing protein n=1 Tax=Streptomyces sp. NPDC101151 TaxID=3366115 RepID=UPI0037F9F6A8